MPTIASDLILPNLYQNHASFLSSHPDTALSPQSLKHIIMCSPNRLYHKMLSGCNFSRLTLYNVSCKLWYSKSSYNYILNSIMQVKKWVVLFYIYMTTSDLIELPSQHSPLHKVSCNVEVCRNCNPRSQLGALHIDNYGYRNKCSKELQME